MKKWFLVALCAMMPGLCACGMQMRENGSCVSSVGVVSGVTSVPEEEPTKGNAPLTGEYLSVEGDGEILRLKEDMVSLGDGHSELVLVREPQTLDGFGASVSSVLTQSFDCPDLLVLHTTRARFTFEKPVPWTRDGEDGGAHRTLTLCNYHAPVELIF